MFSSSRSRRNFIHRIIPCAALALVAPVARSQSVPVPFAATYAGGGTVCSTSLPVFTVSGTGGAKYGDGCPATQAVFNTPVAVAADAYGDIFVADQTYQLVRVIYNGSPALAAAITASNVQNSGLVPVKGNIYTIAGGVTATPSGSPKYCNQAGSGPIATDTSFDGCPATESEQGPRGLAVDADGNLFISSVSPDSQIRVFYVAGTAVAKLINLANPTITSPQPGYVYNVAGGNASSYTGDGALASKATMNTPRGLFIDANENIYFADELNNVIRRVDSTTGFISTVAGHCVASGTACTATATSGDGGAATSANIYYPYAVEQDQYGNLFIAEGGNGSTVAGRIRVVYAGGTLPGITGTTSGSIYTFAGGASGTTPAQLTTFQDVYGVSIDPEGYIYATDYRSGSTGSNHIWRIDPTNGNIAAIAGNGASALTTGNHCNGGTTGPTATDTRGDGCPASQAYLNIPQETLAFDAHGNFYVADRGSNVVRQFSYDNAFPATAVGSSVTQPIAFLFPASLPTTETFTVQSSTASTDYTDGGGDTCALNTTLATATTCVIYVKFAPTTPGQRSGAITISTATATDGTQTLSGIGTAPVLTLAPPSAVTLGSAIQPLGISTDDLGNVNISDGKGKQVLRTTIAGGTPTTYITGLGTPRQTATDSYGNVFVADSTNSTVVEQKFGGGTATFGMSLSGPQGLAVDLLNNLYVADTGNNRLVYISTLTGNQRTVALSGYTLSAPTSLSIDPSGDLFIVDTNNTRVLEIPFGANPQLATLPSGITPSAVSFDPGGDTYLTDTTSGDILLVPVGTTTSSSIVTSLTTPVGVAVGPSGNVFVADSAATSAAGYNFAVDASTFATTNISLTSLPITLTVGSVGNLPATLATPTYVETGTNASAFPAYGTPTCTASLVMAAGSTCTQAFDFAPTTATTPQTAQVVFSDTTGQSVTAKFTAQATNLILTTTTITPANATANYGQTTTYTVTLTPKSTGTSAPTGTIAFVVDGVTKATATVSSNPYTFTASPGVGINSVAALYSGDPIYASSNASTFLTVSKAVTSTSASYTQTVTGTMLSAILTPASVGALTFTGNILFYIDGTLVATVPVGNGSVSATVLVADGSHTYYATYSGDANYATSTSASQPLTVARTATTTSLVITPVSNAGANGFTLSATVATAGSGTPTGSVAFYNGTTLLGTVTLSSTDTATFTTTTTTYTNYAFTATYSGSGLFDPSTVTVTEGADFVVNTPVTSQGAEVTSATPLGVPQGGQAVATIAITPLNGYTGVLTATCTGAPVNSVCRVIPAPLTLSTSVTGTFTAEVYAGVNPTVATRTVPGFGKSTGWLALLILTPFAIGLRRRKAAKALGILAVAVFGLLPLILTGCGLNKTPAASTVIYKTPTGTSTLVVTVTDTNNVSRSTPLYITVNSN